MAIPAIKMETDAVVAGNYTQVLNDRSDELRSEPIEHGGEYVARSLDGRRELLYAASRQEILVWLQRQHINPADVVIEYIKPAGNLRMF